MKKARWQAIGPEGTLKLISGGTEETTFQQSSLVTRQAAPFRCARCVSVPSGRALALAAGLGGLLRGVGHGVAVGVGDVGRLLGRLLNALVGIVGGGDGRLDQRHGALRASRGVLDRAVDARQE